MLLLFDGLVFFTNCTLLSNLSQNISLYKLFHILGDSGLKFGLSIQYNPKNDIMINDEIIQNHKILTVMINVVFFPYAFF